jgi:pimeloyl-ACP methyl ester carboxylesterase
MATAALNWYNLIDALGQDFRVVAPDLRGHGRYGDGAARFTVEGCADDVAALVDQLGTGPVIAVGYSMGGAVAQVLARRHPAAVRGIVLCATAATFAELTWLRPAVKVAGWLAGTAARRWPGAARDILRRQIARRDAAGEAGGRHHAPWAMQDRARSSLACFIEAGAVLNAFDSRSWLHELDVPAAVVVTTQDARVPPWRQDTLTALVAGAERFTVEAGHDAAVAHRDVFLPVLRQACLSVAGEAPSRPTRPS